METFFLKDFIYSFERESTSRGRSRGRSRLPAELGAQHRAWTQALEIMT